LPAKSDPSDATAAWATFSCEHVWIISAIKHMTSLA
jgi:hypothetical protein